jgi:hypothetical protein
VAAKQSVVKKYIVKLSPEEREQLTELIQKGKAAARKLLRARILLKADTSDEADGWSDSQRALFSDLRATRHRTSEPDQFVHESERAQGS